MTHIARSVWAVHEFLAWQALQPERYELVDGKPLRMMSGAKNGHDTITINCLTQLNLQLRGGKCAPFSGDGGVETLQGQIRRPDFGVDCGPRELEAYLAAAPTLVGEVLSPSTRDYDVIAKLSEYKRIVSLRRILLIEPAQPHVTVWSRTAGGDWTSADTLGLDQVIDIPEIGVTLPMAEIYRGIVFPVELRLVPEANSQS